MLILVLQCYFSFGFTICKSSFFFLISKQQFCSLCKDLWLLGKHLVRVRRISLQSLNLSCQQNFKCVADLYFVVSFFNYYFSYSFTFTLSLRSTPFYILHTFISPRRHSRLLCFCFFLIFDWLYLFWRHFYFSRNHMTFSFAFQIYFA